MNARLTRTLTAFHGGVNESNSMVDGDVALGITIPKRAPLVSVIAPRDAVINSCSPYAVINNREVMRRFGPRDSINTLRVYCAICGHVNRRTGLANPSQERLAEILGIARKTVNRAIQRLIKRGLLRLDHKRPAPGGKGSLLFLMPVHADANMTAIDAQSIASYPQSAHMGHLTVSHANTSPMGQPSVPEKPFRDTNARINELPYGTPNCPIASGTPILSHELVEHKNPHGQGIKSADDVIRQWLAYAWKHGQHTPIADEQDLATAHALVAKHVTAEQLETAVIADPEADQLAPLVRSLLA